MTIWQEMLKISILAITNLRLLPHLPVANELTHWGRVTHICVSKLTITGSDNGLSPGRRQAIIWTNAGILLIGPLGTNFSEILIEIQTFSFIKMRLKASSAKWRPFCLGLNVLRPTFFAIFFCSFLAFFILFFSSSPDDEEDEEELLLLLLLCLRCFTFLCFTLPWWYMMAAEGRKTKDKKGFCIKS